MKTPIAAHVYLKEWREFRGMTQEELALAMGIATSYVNMLEKGRRRWNFTQFLAAAYALKVDPPKLLKPNPQEVDALETIWEDIPPDLRSTALRVLDSLRKHPQGER